jgi:hypothetical protein
VLEHLSPASVPDAGIGRVDGSRVHAYPDLTWAGVDLGQVDYV